MEHVAERSNFTLDFAQVDRDLWNATSEASRPKPERPYLDPPPLVNVFALAAKERVGQQKKETGTVHLDLPTNARKGTPYLTGRTIANHER